MSKRFQLVGSLLRPAELLEYKRKIEERDDITYPFYADFVGYEACEDAAIRQVIQKQIDHGIDVISDGEYSKALWHLDFYWGLHGIKRKIASGGYLFRDHDGTSEFETRKDIGIDIVAPLSGKNHHLISIYKKIESAANGHPTKLCIPSVSHMYGEITLSKAIGTYNDHVYTSEQGLKDDLLKSYKEFVDDFVAANGKILQLDDCLWTLFADDNPNSPFTGVGEVKGVAFANEFIELNNAVIDYAKAKGLKVWTHNCRGNYKSRNMGAGSYEKIADLFLKQQRYDRFFLEWDDERAGSLESLKVFADRDGEVVLGLLSSKTSTLDDEARVLQCLDEAAKIIDKNRLFLSHQCGFASCDNGNELTEAQQWAKIEQGQKIALQYWGE
ncbi:MAG: cobalamin-independent methionine synthase II family protein [Oscillospiraceae bacterium]|nr:cobalamin-independent methionine synthase II family protein [Oscillospiraceae bacterium]